jgi:hypothetical protein
VPQPNRQGFPPKKQFVLTDPYQLPSTEVLKHKLGRKEAIAQGATKGMLAASVLTLPIFALQVALGKHPYSMKAVPNLAKTVYHGVGTLPLGVKALRQSFVHFEQEADNPALAKAAMDAFKQKGQLAKTSFQEAKTALFGKTNTVLKQIKADNNAIKPHLPELGKQLAGTLTDATVFGAFVGSMLGLVEVGEVKDKLIQARRMTEGLPPTEEPYTPGLLSFLHPKPITSPQQALADLNAKDLDEDQAYRNGLFKTLWIKGVVGGSLAAMQIAGWIALSTPLVAWATSQKALKSLPANATLGQKVNTVVTHTTTGIVNNAGKVTKGFVIDGFVKQPLLITKALAAPFIGGWIAMSLVPWMNRQLASATVPPTATLPQQR